MALRMAVFVREQGMALDDEQTRTMQNTGTFLHLMNRQRPSAVVA